MIGACVCSGCLVMFDYHYDPRMFGRRDSWTCARCGKNPDKTDLNVISFDIAGSNLIVRRTDFIKKQPKHVRLFKIHESMPHTLFRSFMTDDREPNDVYRTWLETEIGKQGLDWDWDITADIDILQINFVKSEHAVLFELTWPT